MTLDTFLKQVREQELLRFVTAGSVDDGKSTLIGRLLHDAKSIYEDHLAALHRDTQRMGREGIDFALLTDGLKAEREQGITIDVAYRHFSTPKRRFIIADTPGHEQYTRNMATGASTANLAVILIDAKNGVTTQSKRHGFLASLLGIPHLVVAVNKMDLVGYSRQAFEEISAEYAQFAAKLQSRDLTFIPMSALNGDNVVQRSTNMPWYEGPPLLAHLENVHIASDQNLIDFRFPVQYVLRPHHDFRGYCGTVASGVVRVGEEISILPSGKTTRVSRIIRGYQDVSYAFPPQAVTICTEHEIDIARGDMIAHPANVPWVAREVEALVVWMDEKPLEVGKQYVVKHTTNTTRGTFVEIRYRIDPNTLHREEINTLRLNDIGRTALSLTHPIYCDEYQKNRQTGAFIIIDPITNFTSGAGLVIDRAHRYEPAGKSIAKGEVKSREITRQTGKVTRKDREKLLGQKGITIWLTGLSGSGKTTIAYELERRLIEMGRACFVLDGDNIRHGLNRDLGFSDADRSENIRRVAEVAALMNDAGLIVITAFISPFAKDRSHAREIIGNERFIEVFVDAPIELCEQRDPRGLYRKARAGEIPEFTGITSPYEPPEKPDVRIDTSTTSPGEAIEMLLRKIVSDEGISFDR